MTPARIAWLAGALSLVALEVVGIARPRHGLTASEATRVLFRVHTPRGRTVFIVSWFAFAGWFAGHILKRVES